MQRVTPLLRTHYEKLLSEAPLPHFKKKVARKPIATAFYTFPRYLLTRERILNTVWRDYGWGMYVLGVCAPFYYFTGLLKA